MRLGISTAAFYGRMETEEAAEYIHVYGPDTCEVFLETFSEYTATFGRAVRLALGGLHVTSVHPKGTQFESDLFAQSARQRSDAMHWFEGVCRAGEAMGASFYVLHGPASFKRRVRVSQIGNLPSVFPEMQRRAADHGMEILWENVSWCACRDSEDIAWLREYNPQQRFVLDIKQAFRGGLDPMQIADSMGQQLAHVHLLDWTASGDLALPGEGVFDFRALRRHLDAIGYRGNLILEPYSYLTVSEERVRRSLAFLRESMILDEN